MLKAASVLLPIILSSVAILLVVPSLLPRAVASGQQTAYPPFEIPPRFVKYDGNPILGPTGSGWEKERVYNPSVIVENGIFHMFYRAENGDGISGRIGYAWSRDGINFVRDPRPVLVPSEDYDMLGVEDPRVVKIGGVYYMTYTGIDSGGPDNANVCLAKSADLKNWTKLGETVRPAHSWNSYQIKAGALIPLKIGGYYYMYYLGEDGPWRGRIGLARATDLDNVLTWEDFLDHPVLEPRPGPYFDNVGVEPGAVYILENGILLIYNGWTTDPYTGGYIHRTGWAIFSKEDPSRLLQRCQDYIIEEYVPGTSSMIAFSESIVFHDGKWYIHYGMQDRWIGVAIYDTGKPVSRGEWWNENWTRRRPVKIVFSHPENFQIRVVIPPDVPASDYPSIRFLEDENGGVLPYWIERSEGGYLNVAWVRRLENSDDTIWMYYGNPYATSAENGDDVFLFFDDFGGGSGGQTALNRAKWWATDTGIDVYETVLRIEDYGDPPDYDARRVEHGGSQHGMPENAVPRIIEVRVKPAQWWRGGLGLNGPGSFYRAGTGQQYAGFFQRDEDKTYQFFSDGSWSSGNYPVDVFYIASLSLYGSDRIRARFYAGEGGASYRTLLWEAPEKVRNWSGLADPSNYCDRYVLAAWDGGGSSSYYFDWFIVRRWAEVHPVAWCGPVEVLLGRPVLRSPENGSFTNSRAPTLVWTPGKNAERQRLLLDNDPDFRSPLVDVLLGPASGSYIPAGLPDGRYFWKVVALSAYGEAQSDVWSFSVDTVAPQIPAVVFPPEGKPVNQSRPNFRWAAAEDPSGVSYDLQVDDDPDFASPVLEASGISGENYLLGFELREGVWCWRVRAVDGAGNAGGWVSGSFTVDVTPPSVVLFEYSPDPTEDNTPTYSGTAADALTEVVDIEYRVDGGEWRDVDPFAPARTVSFTFTTPPLAEGTHTIEVRAMDGAGNWSGAASDTLTVRAPPRPFPWGVAVGVAVALVVCAVLAVLLYSRKVRFFHRA